MRIIGPLVSLSFIATSLFAQTTASTEPSKPVIAPAEQQIALAVLPAPKEFRDSATVLGYTPDGRLKELRHGTGSMVCLASDPAAERFHVACYHRSLEPFMARGRQLRSQGVKGDQVDSTRFREVRTGRLAFPTHPASLYTLTAPKDSVNMSTGAVSGGRPLYVVYIKNATGATTGLPTAPVEGSRTPWIMHAGTPSAHIMFVAGM
jgi:hypothetical protein